MTEKEITMESVKQSFMNLLPDVDIKLAEEAINACYYDGITEKELSKEAYAYLYPPQEPRLY